MKLRLTIIFTLFLFLVLVFSLNNSFGYLDPDLGWHLKMGQDISRDGVISTANPYNYTLSDRQWINHEWLLDYMSFSIFDSWGYVVLSIVFALLIIVLFGLLFIWLRQYFIKRSPLLYLMYFILSLVGLVGSSPHSGIRMQIFGWLMVLLLLIILDNFSRKQNWRWLLLLPIMFLLWANIHGSFILGLAILVGYIIIKVVEKYLVKLSKFKFLDFSQLLGRKQVIIFIIITLCSVAVTFVNPYGSKLYGLLGGYGHTAYLNYIQEWLPQYQPPINYWQVAYLDLFIVLLIVLGLDKFKGLKINLWLSGLSVLLLILSFKSKRNFPLFFIASFPIMLEWMTYVFKDMDKYLRLSEFKKWVDVRLVLTFALCAYVLAIAGLVIDTRFIQDPFDHNYCQNFPCQAVDFLQDNFQSNNLVLFNYYSWGGYLVWKMPSWPVFIDGRMPQLSYGKHTIIEEYLDFFDKQQTLSKLDDYNIEAVLLPAPKTISLNWYENKVLKIEPSSSLQDFISELDSSPKWHKSFNNYNSVIYLRQF